MRTESLASWQSCRSVDADAWCKRAFNPVMDSMNFALHIITTRLLFRVKIYLSILCANFVQQECIPVGCVPSAAVVVCLAGILSRGVSRGVGGAWVWPGGVGSWPGGWGCLARGGGSVWPGGVWPGVSAQGGVCLAGGWLVLSGGVHLLPLLWTDRRLWKHNLSATTVADGKDTVIYNWFHLHRVWLLQPCETRCQGHDVNLKSIGSVHNTNDSAWLRVRKILVLSRFPFAKWVDLMSQHCESSC